MHNSESLEHLVARLNTLLAKPEAGIVSWRTAVAETCTKIGSFGIDPSSESRKTLFVNEWSIDEIDLPDWAYEGRVKLNGIIREFNTWQMIYNFDEEKKARLIRYIESGINTWAAQDGGTRWLEELEQMRKFIAES